MERWQKIADLQSKLGATQSGIKCANATAVDGVQTVGNGQGFLDIALEQAEQARSHLSDENLFLRKLVLKAVNELHSLLHKARRILPGDCTAEEASLSFCDLCAQLKRLQTTSFTMTAFFVPSSPSVANDKLDGVIDSLDSTLTSLQEAQTAMPASSHKSGPSVPEDEIAKLHGIITKLKEELGALCLQNKDFIIIKYSPASSQKQALSHMTEAQAMFDQFAEDHRNTTGEICEMSVELISVPLRDEAEERLEDLRNKLDSERQCFTEAAVKFGKEKAALEVSFATTIGESHSSNFVSQAERIRFLEEKRAWEVEKMLADLPATPGSSASHKVVPSIRQAFSPKKSPRKPPHRSPRKSPAKVVPVSKSNGGRKSRHLLRTSLALPTNIISYETELIPPLLPTLKPFASSKSSLLPSSFVLPPPSPRASLPNQPALPPARLDVLPEADHKSTDIPSCLPPTVDIHPSPNDKAMDSDDQNLTTPIAPRRPFPVAKPFAQRMFHAYSPAKPSPLSRILMLANSPVTPPNAELQADISQSATSISSEGSSLERAILGFPAVSVPKPPTFLAPEPQYNALDVAAKDAPPVQTGLFNLDSKKHPRIAESNVRSRTSAIGEKENKNLNKQKVFSKPTSAGATGDTTRKVSPTTGGAKATTKSVKGAVGAKTANLVPKEKPISNPSVSRGGPRRVLINSADAPVIGKAWKS